MVAHRGTIGQLTPHERGNDAPIGYLTHHAECATVGYMAHRASSTTPPELLATGAVARALSTDPRTVRRWVETGKLAAIVLPNGRYRFKREDVEALLVPTTVGGER